MNKEKEAFDILLQHIETEADWSDYEKVKNAHKTVEEALKRLEAIDNAEPSEALECLKDIGETCYVEAGNAEEDCILYAKDYIGFNTIKQALMERIVWKNIHNTKVKVPLCDVFNNPIPLSKEERYKYIEHIYYHWEEMKESYETKIDYLKKELEQALLKAQEQEKEVKALEIIKEKKVNILLLELAENVDEYNERIVPNGRLTEEEFNLLKEVLGE